MCRAAGRKFLRGYQITDAHGVAKFVTVYPGWYQGRAVHVHFKLRLFAGTAKTYEFTSQFFFEPRRPGRVAEAANAALGPRLAVWSSLRVHLGGGKAPLDAECDLAERSRQRTGRIGRRPTRDPIVTEQAGRGGVGREDAELVAHAYKVAS